MKKFLIALVFMVSLMAGKANAQTVCGPIGVGPGPTWDVTGQWSYTWPDGYTTGLAGTGRVLHGVMTLVSANGWISGAMGLPAELTDPNGTWNVPVYGTQINGSVMLFLPPGNGSGFDDPWFFEATQNWGLVQRNRFAGQMSGEEFAGAEHYDRHAQFTANYMSGQAARGTVTGAVTPCPTARPISYIGGNDPSYIYYNYNLAQYGLTGQIRLNQSGPWVYGALLPPVQFTPAQQSTWNWPFWGGILTDTGLFIISGPGYGYGEALWFDLTFNPGPKAAFSGTNYDYNQHYYGGTFSMVAQ